MPQLAAPILLITHVQHVNVHAETGIVGKIVANVIRIGINYDRVGIPEPAVAIRDIKRSHAPVEIVEPKTIWTAAAQVPYVAATKATVKAAVLKRMIEMEVRVRATLIMADPLAVVVDVRRFRVAFLVGVTSLRRRFSRAGVGSRAVRRDKTSANSAATTATAVLLVLRKGE